MPPLRGHLVFDGADFPHHEEVEKLRFRGCSDKQANKAPQAISGVVLPHGAILAKARKVDSNGIAKGDGPWPAGGKNDGSYSRDTLP